MGFIIKKSITYNMMDGNQLEYVFDNINLDHITFKGNGKEPFSFNRALVENLIETFETMHDIYSDNCKLKVYTGNCIIQLSADSKDLSESFFDVYDRDEMKMIYTIHNTYLLNTNKLRKDQIYFVNKRDDGSSDLYSLFDYKDFRDGLDAEKAYLQGRFDAIPYIDEQTDNFLKP